jgi:hypothetical protein
VAAPGVSTVVAAARPTEPDSTARSTRTAQNDALLGRVCRLVRDALGVSRATVLVYEEPDRLVPAVSVAREDHDDLWQRFSASRPVHVELTPEVAAALHGDSVVVVPDAAASALVPDEWRTAFALTALAVAPVHVDGRPWGALVVDGLDAGRTFGEVEVRTLAGVAGVAAAALAATERAAAADSAAALRAVLRAALGRLGETRDLAEAVDAVAPFLLEATGFELLSASLREARLAKALNVAPTTRHEADALRLLGDGAVPAVGTDRRLVLPLQGSRNGLGLLVLRSRAGGVRRPDLLLEAAHHFALAVDNVAAADRAAAATAEAEQASARLDFARRAIGQTLRTFRGAGYAARGGATLFSVASGSQARRAVDELDEVRQVLAAHTAGASPAGALRALLDGGPGAPYEAHVTVHGTPRHVAAESEIVCLRSAARFLTLARQARGRVVAARLSFTGAGLECHLSTNGLLPDLADAGEPVRTWARTVGGDVELESTDVLFGVRLTVPYDPPERVSARHPAARARAR